MRKGFYLPLLLLIILAATEFSYAQVSGSVYLDIDNSGTRTIAAAPFEPGVFGVTVRAFNTAGVQVGSTTTDASGAYSMPGVTTFPVRLEFTSLPNQFSAKRTSADKSNVQFVAATTTTADYAVGYSTMFSNNANPWTATTAAINGNPLLGGSSGLARNLYVQEYAFDNTPSADGANFDNRWLGSIFGTTYQRETRTLFLAAYLKRHIGFGPGGIDAIYKTNIDALGAATQPAVLFKLSNLGINVGTDPRTGGANPLGADSLTPNQDLGVFGQIGKVGIGNIDLAENGKDLYVTNLFENKVHRINIGMPVKSSFTSSDVTGTWVIPGPTLSGSEQWHIMGVKYYQGKVYVGGVRSKQRTDAPVATAADRDADQVNLTGHVYELDPVTGTITEVLQFPFNYKRGYSNSDRRYEFKNNWWRAWQNNGGADNLRNDFNDAEEVFPQPSAPFNTGNNTGIYYPQPMLSDIEFDVDGSMIIGVRDRFGDQTGFNNYLEGANGQTALADGRLFRGLNSGEVLRAGKNISNWTFENNAQVTTNSIITNTNAGNAQSGGVAGNPPANALTLSGTWNPSTGQPYGWSAVSGFGPGGRYYYYNHAAGTAGVPVANIQDGSVSVLNSHYVKSNGGLALFAGYDEVIQTAMDPDGIAFASGLMRLANKGQAAGTNAGNMTDQMQLLKAFGVTVLSGPAYPGTMGKSNGLGDIELLQEAMPIEIGNRIWNDANGNGIQDANETGIGSVTVVLRSPGSNGIFGDGDDQTWTTATDANGNYYFDKTAAGGNVNDTRAATLGYTGLPSGNTGILNSQDYRIEIDPTQANLTNYRISVTDVNGATSDNIDNDGAQANLTGVGTRVFANVNTSNNDYNFDIGFKQLGAIGDKVWLDNGAGAGGTASDGIQNGNEPGVAGVTVELRLNGTVIASTVTDAYGNYFFDNLATGGGNVYTIKVTPPANYSFTTQTNTANDQVNDAAGSDVIAAAGLTYGVSYNITLTAGEIERDIDAGLIFNTVPALASVGDKVWLDNGTGGGVANDGLQNGSEPGVSGITVTLFNAAGTPVATTVTDVNGNYLFSNLAPGTYSVGFTLPPTFTFSPKDVTAGGGNDNNDSDPNTSGVRFGRTDDFTLAAGEQKTNTDAGINLASSSTASIGDRVWNDIDRDGIQDAGEPGIGGVTVTIVGPSGTFTVVTDANGNFQVTNLTPGSYTVTITNPNNSQYTFTTQNVTTGGGNNYTDSDLPGGATATSQTTVSLSAGQRGDVDAGLWNNTAGLNSIGNFVWYDDNGNGVQDAGEIGVPGVTATIINLATGTPADNPALAGVQSYIVATDKNGFYAFTDLPNGNYVIIFGSLPNGFAFTTPVGAGDNGTASNSDVTAASGTTAIYNLSGGEYDQTVDAGLVRGIASGGPSLGNRVWYDLNNNGIQDAPVAGTPPELGVAGVTVTLVFAGANGAVGGGDDVTVAVTTTDQLGNYLFTNGNVPGGLLPGITYYITFTGLPAGYSFSGSQNAGTNDEVDSDVSNIGTGATGIYILSPTEENLSVDAGINNLSATAGSISNLVFYDLNSDGVQTTGEPGVPGITARLFNDGADGIAGNADDIAVAVTTTDVNGNYLFDGLPARNYTIYFSNYPAGFTGTLKGSGGNNTLDSDAPGTGKTDGIALAAGQDRTDIDFGISSVSAAALGNFVWFDNNGNGIQDAGEPGIAGVTVSLYFNGGLVPVTSAITDANGGYFFSNLAPGNYVVEFTNIPTGTNFTVQDQTSGGGNDNNDSDVDPSTGRTASYTLAAGQVNLSADAGIRRQTTANVGNFVWYDLDGNGIRNGTEPAAGGVTVTLLQGSTVIGTAVTADDGGYLFTNVPPGTYTIQFGNLPPATNYTTQNVGGGAGIDNNSNPNNTGLTNTFTVTAGGSDISIDAGLTGVPLPVDALILSAGFSGSTVALKWKTYREVNTDYFEIERSVNNINFEKVGGKIAAAGNSELEKLYNKDDDVAGVQHSGVLYYRVKLYDIDGKFRYSNIVTVRLKGNGIKVWPNPFKEVLQISITSQNSGRIEMRLTDVTGRTILKQTNTVTRGINQLSINNLDNLPKGTYFLYIQNPADGNVKTIKLLK